MQKNRIYKILIPSYLDPLGHPIFADKIAENISHIHKNAKILMYCIDSERDIKDSNYELETININFFGKFFNYSTKKYLLKLNFFGVILFYAIRLISITIFYIKVFKRSNPSDFVIDLEYEPIQDLIASPFKKLFFKRISIIHSFEYEGGVSLKMLYKKFSLMFVRKFLRDSTNNKIGFMNSKAIKSAKFMGFPKDQIILAGWGYDSFDYKLRNEKKGSILQNNSEKINVLSFGLIRETKMLSKITELFLIANLDQVQFNIVGKSIDNEIEKIRSKIQEYESSTSIILKDEYIEEEDIENLILSNDIMLISHEAGFTSISGPLLLAFQYRKPILCFSKNTVKDLVEASSSGLALDLDRINPNELIQKLEFLKDHKYSDEKVREFQWKEITRRLILES